MIPARRLANSLARVRSSVRARELETRRGLTAQALWNCSLCNTKLRRATECAKIVSEKRGTEPTSGAMPPFPDSAVFQERWAALPVATYEAGETVFAAGSRTGRLLILRKGAVVIVKEDVEIARVTEPGAVFGELSVLLDQPHTAHVRALETSEFFVADATTFLAQDPIAARTLRRSLHGGWMALIEFSFN